MRGSSTQLTWRWNDRERSGAWRRWVAAAAVFLLAVLGGGFYAVQTPDGVATLDANPSIELTVNKLGRVLSVRACNADAQIVLISSMRLKFDAHEIMFAYIVNVIRCKISRLFQ